MSRVSQQGLDATIDFLSRLEATPLFLSAAAIDFGIDEWAGGWFERKSLIHF